MIGTVAVLWSIGFLAYSFAWTYFWSWAQDPGKRTGQETSLWQNLGVFAAYLVLTFLSAYSILSSGRALLSDNGADVEPAWRIFTVTVVGYFGVFFFEVRTTICSVAEGISREGDP